MWAAEKTRTSVQYVFPHNAPNKTDITPIDARPKFHLQAAGEAWEDSTLAEWNPNDFRIFVGDLGNEVNDEGLVRAFMKYPSFLKARVLRDKRSGKSRGYGFVSFGEASDGARALKEVNGKYIGNRPCKLRKSTWKDRLDDSVPETPIHRPSHRPPKKNKKHLGGVAKLDEVAAFEPV
eukprot:TRINITY_DN377_c0_g1_i3.p1 TRINITY_DN377_c0_g1~~TRINITY_DN377_c0_g1_i3.p1  ORF type:complete len:178 (+),score=34.05 TRINITY_DN377_c0_g1_i3:238-771(+)